MEPNGIIVVKISKTEITTEMQPIDQLWHVVKYKHGNWLAVSQNIIVIAQTLVLQTYVVP